MRFSCVVVVLRPDIDDLLRTLDSVLAQSHADKEIIVKSGSGPLELHGRNARLVVQSDTGIYEAFNQALDRCSGDVIHFLGAGDVLADSECYASIASGLDPGVEFALGTVTYVDESGRPSVHLSPPSDDCLGQFDEHRYRFILPTHPEVFARRELFDLHRFDPEFSISGDVDWMLRALVGRRPSRVPTAEVRMLEGGVSAQMANAMVKHRELVPMLARLGLRPRVWWRAKRTLKVMLLTGIGRLLGR